MTAPRRTSELGIAALFATAFVLGGGGGIFLGLLVAGRQDLMPWLWWAAPAWCIVFGLSWWWQAGGESATRSAAVLLAAVLLLPLSGCALARARAIASLDVVPSPPAVEGQCAAWSNTGACQLWSPSPYTMPEADRLWLREHAEACRGLRWTEEAGWHHDWIEPEVSP